MPDNILWPAYFDANSSRADGRRVARDLAIPDPTVEEIAKAVQQVGYDARIEREVAYPREPWSETGRVVVEGADDDAKNDIVQAVAAYLQVIREE